MKLLAIEELVVRFGGVTALDGPSLHVDRGSICGLIGPNGAGKTTLFNCVSRLYTPQSGSIAFDGEDLLARAPHGISARERRLRAEADDALARMRLSEVADHPAAGLPFGTLKRVELARAVFHS